MAGVRKLVIEILGSAKGAADAFGDVRKHSDITKEKLDKFGTAALGAGVAIAGGLAYAVTQFVEADTAARKLADSVASSEHTFKNNGQAINDLATAVQNKTGADGDALIGASALAVQWGLQEQAVLNLLPLVNDLSMKMGVGVDQAMKAVLKSTDGSTGALGKMGLNMAGVKDAADPFAATIDLLQKQVGGFGEEIGGTAAGKVAIMKQQLGDLVEAVGGGAMDVFGPVLSGLSNLVTNSGPAGQAAGDIAGKVLAIGSAGLIAVGGIIKIKGAIDTAKSSLTDGEGGLNNFGKAAQGVGIAAAGIGTAFALWQVGSAINEATKDTLGFETAVNNLKTALSFNDRAQQIADMANATQGLRDKYFDFLATVASSGSTDNPMSRSFDLGGQKIQLDAMKDGLEKMRASGDMTGVASTIGFVRDNAKGSDRAMADLNAILVPFEKNAKSAAGAAKAEAEAHGEAAAAADDQNAALKALTDPIFGAMRATQQNTDAQQKFQDAQNKVNFLTKIGQTNSGDFATALHDLQTSTIDAGSAAVNQQSAMTTLGGLMKDNKGFTGDFNSTLQTLQEKFGLSKDAAGRLALGLYDVGGQSLTAIGGMNGTKKSAGELDGTRANVRVTGDSSDAQGAIDVVKLKLANLLSLNSTVGVLKPEFKAAISAELQRRGKATGGTVIGGNAYLVGERGPEIVVPGSGYVIPTRRLVDQQAGGGSSGGIVVNVTTGVGDPAAIGRGVVDALKAYERTAGTSWRN